MARTKDMTNGSPIKLIITFTLPLLLANLGQQVYTIVDASIVGRGVGVEALAAVGATEWFYWLIMWSMISLAQGFSTFISRYFGEKNFEKTNKAIANSIMLCLICSITVEVLSLIFCGSILKLLNTPGDIFSDSKLYLSTLVAGLVIVALYNMAASILRAFGDSKSPLVSIFISASINIFLDLLFVLVFKWGIFGAAFATILSQGVSLIYCIFCIKKIEYVKLKKSDFIPDLKMMREFMLFSLPICFQAILVSIGGILVQSVVNTCGIAIVAGYTATNKLYGLLESSAVSIGHAITTFVSQNFGAGSFKRIRHGVKSGAYLALGASLVIMLFSISCGKFFLQLFINAKGALGLDALHFGYRYLFWMAIFLPVLYMIHVCLNTLVALGKSIWSFVSGLMELVARILSVKVLIIPFGTEILYYIEPISWTLALLSILFPCIYKIIKLKKEA